ncbi:ribokinase [Adhaeribacter aerolatus]|uniref:Ribokinase n=1 Tax=Adhaeribacter aerolatus TaxID=670289 RepID=A0A512B168_9BACT|nr:ribokinase [Adhaeribacter aerolatus]GEO05714.1 ribokinase [Adhaeribacter aerolatus]
MTHTEILVVGSSNTDMVIKSDKLPLPGETVLGGTFFMNPGGKGANQAVAAARLGGKVTFVAKVGSDIFGQQALQQFGQEGINTAYVTVDAEHPSGVALININQNGENCIAVAPGANGQLKPRDVAALEAADTNTIVLLQLEIPLATVEYVIRQSYEKGLRVILNPAPAQTLPPDLFPLLYLITPNETEAEILTGIRVTDTDTARIAAAKLQALGVANVIITMGARGAFLQGDSVSELIPVPVVTATDTTAAGDCFNGALAVALAENQPLRAAVTFAGKGAAISVTRLGAQAAMPYRKEVDAMAAQDFT